MMKIAFSLILIFTCCAVTSFSQASQKWKRIESDDLSISIPPAYLVDAEKKNDSQIRKIFAFQKGVSLEFEASKPGNPKGRLRFLAPDKDYSNSSFKVGNFEIVRMSSKVKIQEKIFLASKKNFYVIEITSEKSALEIAHRILVSIKTEGKPLFVQSDSNKNPVLDEEPIKLSELKTSPEITETIAKKTEKQKINVINNKLNKFQDDFDFSELSRPPIILEKPNPVFRPSLNSLSEQELFVKLKVTFLANGMVGDIVTFSNSNASFVSSCVDAAQKIKFIPAQKDGINVDSTFIVEYRLMSMVVAAPVIRPF